MSLFHSLGSNYTSAMTWTALQNVLHPWADQMKFEESVRDALSIKDGRAEKMVLTYKGRDAIEFAVGTIAEKLRSSTKSTFPTRYGVLTQGLACHAIEEGIIRGGMTPIYVDLEPGTLGPSVATVRAAMRRAEAQHIQPVALFLQHTLGYGNPVAELSSLARSENLYLIEDLAQSYGATDVGGQLLGSSADMIIYSFGRDKILDGVSGGAVSFRDSALQPYAPVAPKVSPPAFTVIKELLYPALTRCIRVTHEWGLGKVLFKIAKLLRLFTSPIATARPFPTRLPAAYLRLVSQQLAGIDQQLGHRRLCAAQYLQELSGLSSGKILVNPLMVQHDVHLRVPVLLDDPAQLAIFFKKAEKERIFLTDRWYRDVVDSGSLALSSVYRSGECPEAEKVSQRLLNLPTHAGVTTSHIRTICKILREVLEEKGNYVS